MNGIEQLGNQIAAFSIVLVMGMALVRAIAGPTVYDRTLAVNMFGTKTVLLICVIDFLGEHQGFLDIALAYALISFIGVVALLKFYVTADHLRSRPAQEDKRP